MKKTTLGMIGAAIIFASGVAVADNYKHDKYHGDGYGRHNPMGVMCNVKSTNLPRGFGLELNEMTVKQILSDSKEDDIVRIKGRLTKYLGDEKFELTDNSNDTIIVELDEDRNWSYLEKDMPIEVVAKVDDEKVTKILEVRCARPDFGDKMPRPPRANGPRGFEQGDIK
ncbi:Predicted protein YdeI with OB-fold, BOF family [Succinivibrio dextrinosolvens]|uniref:NirD/YgiW/YdeI family stress tolerance protein n=1 Tax=Succinivibrio dextrinosolvens TaxID=83771 RepID=UPI0008DF53E4|nr:NirD/YgiW/YdeI family stress tolerance protein [Succinivibrio dextrinosolvens]SFS37970.1 Predicted protein YdeI with OB-fold, BOF family [Succinivibrio dextrinosolvens]